MVGMVDNVPSVPSVYELLYVFLTVQNNKRLST